MPVVYLPTAARMPMVREEKFRPVRVEGRSSGATALAGAVVSGS